MSECGNYRSETKPLCQWQLTARGEDNEIVTKLRPRPDLGDPEH
jgi:hypothetical protein